MADQPDKSWNLVADTGRASRIGLWALALALGGFVLWASLAPLDEGVPSQGQVTIDTKRKAVQHLTGGIIRQVLVKEGQLVQEGQVLIELERASAQANYEVVRQRYLNLRAMQGRLLAEQTGAATIQFHRELRDAMADPLVAAQMQTQVQLMAARRAALQADLRAIEESIKGQEAMLLSFEGMLVGRNTQLRLLQEELRNTRELVKDGYAPRNRQLELERSEADAQAAIAELQGNVRRAQQAIAEQRQRAVARQQQYRQEVETQQADVGREVESDAARHQALKADLERIEIKAPASGQVVGLALQTVGGVVQPGQKLMDIVPADEPLLLEARIEPHLIDRVRAGLPTDIRFSAFAHSPQLVVAGEVQSVSSDLITEQQGATAIAYYLARVRVMPEGLKTLGNRRLQPGMPAQIVIRTGERSMLTYLLNPLMKRLAASMKEE